jgi:hypothetical protein
MSSHLRDQVPVEFIMAVADHFEEDGVAALRKLLTTDPGLVRTVLASVLSERQIEDLMDEPTDEALDDAARRVAANIRRDTPAEGKPRLEWLN